MKFLVPSSNLESLCTIISFSNTSEEFIKSNKRGLKDQCGSPGLPVWGFPQVPPNFNPSVAQRDLVREPLECVSTDEPEARRKPQPCTRPVPGHRHLHLHVRWLKAALVDVVESEGLGGVGTVLVHLNNEPAMLVPPRRHHV